MYNIIQSSFISDRFSTYDL